MRVRFYFHLSWSPLMMHDVSDGRRAKKAKTNLVKIPNTSNHPKLQQTQDTKPHPSWYPNQQCIWDHAMLHVNPFLLKEGQSPHCFALPPVHIFWGATEQNQKTFYYNFLVLRDQFSLRAQRNLPGLTIEQWRSVLGNAYWKSMWPKPAPGGSFNFDPLQFWIHGGPLILVMSLAQQPLSVTT